MSKSATSPTGSAGAGEIWGTDSKRRGKYRFGKQQIQFYKPTEGYPEGKAAKKKPKARLELEHAYGFSGGSRQNLYSRDGKLIYYIAACGVSYNIEENSQKFFLDHNDDITTICMDPREGSTLVASGQKDPKDTPGEGKDLPKIYIWDMNTCEKICLIDRVTVNLVRRIQWSAATGYLYVICGDDQQSLKVYDLSSLKSGAKCDEKKIASPLLDQPTTRQTIMSLNINPSPTGCVDELVFCCQGKLMTCKITEAKGKLVMNKMKAMSIKGKEKAFLDAYFLSNGQYAVAAASGNIYLCEGEGVKKTIKNAHKKAVKAFCANADGSVWYSSGMNGCIKAWDLEGNKQWETEEIKVDGSDFVNAPQAMVFDAKSNSIFIGSKSNQIMKFSLDDKSSAVVIDGHDGQVWGVAAHPKKPLFVTGGWDRAVKVWDPKTWTCQRTYEFPKSSKKDGDEKSDDLPAEKWRIMQTRISPNGNWIACGTDMSTLVILSFNDLQVKAEHRIPLANAKNELEGIDYLRWSPNGKYLAAAHGDGHVYVFSVIVKKDDSGDKSVSIKQWKKMKCRAAPSHVQWGTDNLIVKALTRDYEVAHFVLDAKKKTGKMTAKIPDPDLYSFEGDPLIAGWDVQGLYQEGMDGTDINDAAVTSDKKFVLSGDDFGHVWLYNYPAVDNTAGKSFSGHAEHVMGVTASHDDEYVYSVGAADLCILQWRLVKDE